MRDIDDRNFDLADEVEASSLDKRIVFLTGQIDEITASFFVKSLMYLTIKSARDPIRVILSSEGGDCYYGILAYTGIKDAIAAGAQVTVEVQGLCASMAVEILQAASVRVARVGSRFLLHEVREFKVGDVTSSDAEESAIELKKVNNQMAEIIAGRTGKSVAFILKTIRKRDYWLNADEAKAFGLVDEVR